jgi:hypothetical protein
MSLVFFGEVECISSRKVDGQAGETVLGVLDAKRQCYHILHIIRRNSSMKNSETANLTITPRGPFNVMDYENWIYCPQSTSKSHLEFRAQRSLRTRLGLEWIDQR